MADDAVGLLQAEAARSIFTHCTTDVVGELATRSELFRTRWAAHNVKAQCTAPSAFTSTSSGELTLNYNVFDITATPGLSLVGYTAEPESPSAQTLGIMDSWSAAEELS